MLVMIAAAAYGQEAPVVTLTEDPEVAAEADVVPVRLSVFPGVGLGAQPDARVDGVSFGFVSHGKGLDGVDAELGWSWVDGPVDGVQASIGANVADELEGAQLSVGANWARGDVRTGQLTVGANIAEGDLQGMQGSVGANVIGGRLQGLQATTGLNVVGGEGSQGAQLSAGLNVARDLEGLQGGIVNVASEVQGAQLGLVNVGGDVKGLQLGLVNVAKTSEVSIAPINLIGDGLHRIDVWTSESAIGNVGLKLGSKQVYTLLGVGWVNPEQPWWTFGGGFGVHVGPDPFWIEIDDSVWGLATGNVVAPGLHNKLRLQVGVDIVDHFAPFVGVSMNTWVGTGAVWPRPVGLPHRIADAEQVVTWPGVHAGISF